MSTPRRGKGKRCSRTGKVMFRSKLQADIALARLRWLDAGQVRTYRCEFCNCWHLTSQPKKGEPND